MYARQLRISVGIRHFFALNIPWLSFIHPSWFTNRLDHPHTQRRIRPCLLLAMLAVVALAKANVDSPCGPKRQSVIRLADAARSMLDRSVTSQSMDSSIAQAAMVLTVFEAYPHHTHSSARFAAALMQLDTIVRACQLIVVDVNDERASIFIPEHVPFVTDKFGNPLPIRPSVAYTEPVSAPEYSARLLSRRGSEPLWPIEWTTGQIEQEETRRMCWMACCVAGRFNQFQCATSQRPISLYLTRPENVSRLSGPSPSHRHLLMRRCLSNDQ